MNSFGHCMKSFALAMALVIAATSLPINLAQAAMVTTGQVVAAASQASDRARIMDFMARGDVRQQFETLGIDPDEAARRALSLSDEEIRQIAGRLDQLPAGEDSAIGFIVGAILVILLVLLITDLLGLTDVFPFVRAQR